MTGAPAGPTDEFWIEPLSFDEVRSLLATMEAPWWLAGGWAIDLFVGRPTRPHLDVEISVLHGDQRALRRSLRGWDAHVAHDGALSRWARDEQVEPPRHQLWVRRDASAPWSLEVLLEQHEGDEWVCRKDDRIRLPLDRLGWTTGDGLPVLAPEVALLFKGREPREKDDHDLAMALPLLPLFAREWLRSSLELLAPTSPWVERFRSGSSGGA